MVCFYLLLIIFTFLFHSGLHDCYVSWFLMILLVLIFMLYQLPAYACIFLSLQYYRPVKLVQCILIFGVCVGVKKEELLSILYDRKFYHVNGLNMCVFCWRYLTVFNQKTLYNAYKKRTKNIDIDLEEYNRMKEADPEFYREASSLQYGKV